MPEAEIGINFTSKDQASPGIQKVSDNIKKLGDSAKQAQNGLNNITSGAGQATSAMSALGQAVSTAAGFIMAQLGSAAVMAIRNLVNEMVSLARVSSQTFAQTSNLLKNLGFANVTQEITAMIEKEQELSGIDSNELQKGFNTIISVTKDRTKAMEFLSIAEDLAIAKGLDMETSAKLVSKALEGDIEGLKRYGVYLNEASMASMTASQKTEYFRKEMEKLFGGSTEAYRQSAAGMMANFENQVSDLKKGIGQGILEAIAPAFDEIATKLSSFMKTESFGTLVDSIGSLTFNIIEMGEKSVLAIGKLFGLKDIESIAGAVSASISGISLAIEKVGGAMDWLGDKFDIMTEKANKAIALQAQVSNIQMSGQTYIPGLGYLAPSNVTNPIDPFAIDKSWRDNPPPNILGYNSNNETKDIVDENTKKTINNTEAIDWHTFATDSAAYSLGTYREKVESSSKSMDDGIRTVADAMVYAREMANQAAASAAAARLGNSSGGGGGGSCRSFGRTVSTVSDGHSEYSYYDNGPSSSPGVSWYNTLGNENAGVVAAMGEKWASTINANSIVYNGCSGLVCSFDTVDKQTINGVNSTVTSTFMGDGQGGFSEIGRNVKVNDALITKRGDIVQFNPEDDIYATKSGIGSKSNLNLTFNIYESKDAKALANEILRIINLNVKTIGV